MAKFLINFAEIFLLLQIFWFQEISSHLASYKCNSTSYTLFHGLESKYKDKARLLCKDECSLSEARIPSCQRHLNAPMALCNDAQSWRIKFRLKVWPNGTIPAHKCNSVDIQDRIDCGYSGIGQDECVNNRRCCWDNTVPNSPDCFFSDPYDHEYPDESGSFGVGFAEALTLEPTKHTRLVADMADVVFVQNAALTLNWTSYSTDLQFTVDHSLDGLHWNDYTEDGQVKVFKIHSYHPTACLCRKILARFLRINIAKGSDFGQELNGFLDTTNCPSLRPDKPIQCKVALGMESGEISDPRITASSVADHRTAPKVARLNRQDGTDGLQGAWVPSSHDTSQWLQIDLLTPQISVSRVATQGRNGNGFWVSKYKLEYRNDGENFKYYKEQGQDMAKEFTGNTDRDTIVYNDLNPPITARFIRFRPVAWSVSGIGMRVELFSNQACVAGSLYKCKKALGVESGAITDKQMSASSEHINGLLAAHARLTSSGFWVPSTQDVNQWLQVDLVWTHSTVNRVATQGRSSADQWVTSYKLQYSNDGTNFQYYTKQDQVIPKVFAGNIDRNTIVYNDLNPPIRARFVRFRPTGWNSFIAMRVEIFGCQGELSKLYSFNSFAPRPVALNDSSWHLGCHSVNISDTRLVYSGLNSYGEVDQKRCTKRCSILKYRYAAIQSGLLCFCSNEPPSNPVQNQFDCKLPSFPEWSYDQVAMRFFRAPEANLTVTDVSLSHKRRRLGEGFTIAAKVNSDEMKWVTFTLHPGDGNELVFCDSPATYFYKNPGSYKLSMIIEDVKGTQFTFTDSVLVADNITQLNFTCPQVVAQGHEVDCTITLARSLSVKGVLRAENLDIPIKGIPDSRMSRFGEEVPHYVPATEAVLEALFEKPDRTYVLTKNQVQEEGYLANLEINVLQAGPISVQILRQVNDPEEPFTSKSHMTCTADSHKLYMDYVCCGSAFCEPLLEVANPTFAIVADVIIMQHLSEGYHFIDLTNITQVKVLSGDMLGWYSSSVTGKVAVVGEALDNRGIVFEGAGNMVGKTLGPGQNTFAFNNTFALSAYVVPLSSYELSFNLEKIARHEVVVSVNDDFGNVEERSAEIVYQQAILGLTVSFPEYALKENVSIDLSVANGTNTSYIVYFEDGQFKEAFNPQSSVIHNYNSTGTQKLTVIAYNDVSAAVTECVGPYILDAVAGLDIPVVQPVATNENVPIIISLSQGSLVDLNVSLGDDSPSFNVSLFDVNDSFVVVKNHTYKKPGLYRITAFATNNFSNASAERYLTVQDPIAGLNVSVQQGVHSSDADLVINISVTQGTDVYYNVSLLGQNKSAAGRFANVTFYKDTLTYGLALLEVRAHNLLSHNESFTNISIETPIYDAKFWPIENKPKALKAGKRRNFRFFYARGSNLNLTFWKGTGEQSVPITPPKEGVTLSIDFTYANPGVYTARAIFSNVLGSVVVERAVIVQHPVENIEIITDSPRPLPPGVLNVDVKQNGIVATNATLQCSFGDETESEWLEFPGEFNISHRYSMAGNYKIAVNIANLFNEVLTVVDVSIINTVTFLTIKAKMTAVTTETLFASGNNFPLEHPVRFEIDYDGDVNITHYRYDFGDGTDFNSTTADTVTAKHSYDLAGEYTVTITLQHQFGEISKSTTVSIKESLAGLTISDDAPSIINNFTNFTFEVDTFGTGTLIKVDFGDGQSVIFDMESQLVNASAKSFTFQHAYEYESLYEVDVYGWNDVSSAKLSHFTVAVEEMCRYPDPKILQVGASPETAAIVAKDKEIIIYTNITISCKASYQTLFEWKVEYLSENGSVALPIDTDFDKSTLTIPPRTLQYGNISVQFKVKMEYIIEGIESLTVGFINVVPTDLRAKIYGGHFRAVSSKRRIIIDGSMSEDPDVGQGNLTGIQFFWFCRRANESFYPGIEELPTVTFKQTSLHSGYGGCEGNGPRMLNYTGPALEISPGMLMEDETYFVELIIRKDNREASVEQTFQVFGNVLPEVTLVCTINCGKKVSTNNQLSMSSICVNCDEESFTSVFYQWEMHVLNENTGDWSKVNDLESKTLINLTEHNFALRHDTLDVGKKYKLTCRVTNGEGIEGRSEYHFFTDTPPQNGTCTISPTEGKVVETNFNIQCPGWEDEDGVVSYKVFNGKSLIQHGQGPILSPTLLPLGPHDNNYTYDLTVEIFDNFNSLSVVKLPVTVGKATLSAEQMHDMTHEDGLLTNMRISGNTQGIAQLVMGLSAVLDDEAAQEKLNQNGTTGREGGELKLEDSEEKKERMEIKEEILGVFEQLELESIDTAGLIVESMSSVTSNVEELSSESQNSMLNVLENAVTTLSAKQSADSLSVITSVSNGLVANLGNLFGASKYQHDKSAMQMASLNDREKEGEKGKSKDSSQQMAELDKKSNKLSEHARNMAKKAMELLDNVLDMLGSYQATGQERLELGSERMSAMVVKVSYQDIAGYCFSIGGGHFCLPSSDVTSGWADEECFLIGKGINAKDNPFLWHNSSSEVDSNILGLKFEDCHGQPVNVTQLQDPITIRIPRDDAGEVPAADTFTTKKETMKTHKLNIDDPSNSINAVIHPGEVNCSHEFKIFLRKNEYPTIEEFDFNWTMEVIPGVAEWKEGFPLSVSNYQLNQSESDSGVYYVGFYLNLLGESRTDDKCSELNYTLLNFLSSCNYWDEDEEKWVSFGCEGAPETTFFTTVCLCTHLTNFGGGFLVAPNPIDFDAAFAGFTDIASNPVVFATVITIFGLYFVGVIWARWKDKKDLEKVGVTPLLSNDPRDTYGYEITLQTGFQQKTRTTADVFIQLFGTYGDSEPRMLKDPKRAKFGRGEIDQFLLTVPQSLGTVKEIHIWHNNAGKAPAWYVFRVLIRDLQTDSKWWFVCDQWLAVEEGDGSVDRRLTLATKEELTKFNILFVNATRKNLLDGHLWLSVFTRPPKSPFTRVQRLSCCLSLILSTMLANLMFYQVGADDNSTASQAVHIGPFILSVKQILIGVQSSFVVLPVNMIIVSIFRKLKPKEDKSKKYEEIGEEEEVASPKTIRGQSAEVDNSKTQFDQIESPGDSEDNSKKKAFTWRTLVNIFKRDDDSDFDKKKAKKKFMFPHWCIYIAYLLVVLSSLTSGLFCMLYGFTFGKEKSIKWLTSMLVSFFQSVIVIQPFKVLVIAAFFALIIKDPNKEEEQEDATDPALNTDEEFLSSDAERGTRKPSLHSKPPDAKKLEAARKLRLKQCQMKAIIKEIISHFLVVCVVLIVAYGNHDDRSFVMTNEVRNVLVDGDPNVVSFNSLNNKDQFWNWAINNLVPSLFPSSGSHEYPYFGIIKNGKVSNVLGVGRIRQLRLKKDTCKVPEQFSAYVTECNDYYSWSDEDTRDFDIGWSVPSPKNDTKNKGAKKTKKKETTSPWHYQSVLEASSFPYMGKMATYRGGGFIVELGPDNVTALIELKDLQANDWIDRYTRALFTELSIYNVNINLLCVVTLLYEELPTGGGYTFINVQTIRLYRYIGNFSSALMACEVIFAFLLINWIVRDAKRLWKERKAFWKKPWNVVDFSVTVLSITSLSLYFARLVFLNSAVGKLREDRSKFVSFQYVVLLNEGVNMMIALVVLLLNLKFLRMMRFNRKISVISSTIKASAAKLASFIIMFLVIFVAYCLLVYLVFGPDLEDYRSFIKCMVSMMSMVLGNFEFYDLVAVNRYIGPAVFFTFTFFFQFILINMFVGILCDSFSEVRNDSGKQANEYEIVQFISNRIKAFAGFFVEPPIRPVYNWPKSELQQKIETIEEKADTTMFFMRNLCDEDVRQLKWFQPDKWSSKKSKVMSLVLNSEAEILENDLCDGIQAMNEVVEKYSEHELDRMIAVSRMKRRKASVASSVMLASGTLTYEGSEAEDTDSDDEDTQDDQGESVLKVKGLQTLQDKINEVFEDSALEEPDKPEEYAEENDDDEEKCDEVDWEEELELLEESLEDDPPLNTPEEKAGSTPEESSKLFIGDLPSATDINRYTRGNTEELCMSSGSLMKSTTSLRSVPPSIKEDNEDTESESGSHLDGTSNNGLQEENKLPVAVFPDRSTASTPLSCFGDSTLIFIPDSDENMEGGSSDTEEFIADGTVLRVKGRSQSNA